MMGGGASGDRRSRQTTAGALRQPTLRATRIVSAPATAAPISPIPIWMPQITARMRSARPSDAEVAQMTAWATGSQDAMTSARPSRIRSARPCDGPFGVAACRPVVGHLS
jgi:hypothetical protein